MRKLAIAVPAAIFSLTAVGQDLLQCVDPDVANGLLFNGRAETALTVTGALPEDMSGYRAPAGFELVGTAVRGAGTTTTVAFKTALSSEDAYAALLASLEPDGWAVEANERIPQTFNVASQPVSGTVCRNTERLSLRVQDADGVRYATVSAYPDQPARACNAEDPRLASGGRAMFDNLRSRMPTLDFPANARAVDGFGGGMGGSGQTVSTSSRIQSPDSAASLSALLAGQLTAQGWSRDAAWTGSLSSGSTWTQQGDDAEPYWGTLEIVSIGGGTYHVGFMLMTRPF